MNCPLDSTARSDGVAYLLIPGFKAFLMILNMEKLYGWNHTDTQKV